jgi:phage-related holin
MLFFQVNDFIFHLMSLWLYGSWDIVFFLLLKLEVIHIEDIFLFRKVKGLSAKKRVLTLLKNTDVFF